ncbi:GntR family transcriptional regulator [Nesterenkonia sp. HG001]|uniref:GntR family transcriptional regulator n=1 Tax=Nesterenkonia sp. HG001 TaxID=2983207 RepID=UPI002AC78F09|nr:GntR family transcriptional regulator [Nesterenkonia sp. HG001]MDZ5078699.1 GntR family transcriptional regulator [Nesterenkonia sp. HG001]
MTGFAFTSIAEALREEIRAGVLGVGDSLPSERALSERFGVSPGTVRVALKELVSEGTVDGTRGRPKTVVRVPRPQSSFGEFHSFAQWARGHGREPGGQVMENRWQIASEMDEALLQARVGQRVLAVTRLRSLDGETVMLERTHYPEWLGEIVEALPPETPSVTAVLAERHQVHFSHAEHMFGAEGAKARDATMLGISRGTALLMHRRVSRDPAGRVLEWSTDRYISGRILLSVGNSWNSNPLRWALPGSEPGL